MRLAGYQPVSLLDFPGKVCGIVFTQGCPFRCVYCHNPELIPLAGEGEGLSVEEVLGKIRQDRALLEGVCVTGGEPTIHPDLPEFLKAIKELGLLVKLDTNGLNPALVARCIEENLVDFFAMDLKHRWDKYEEIVGKLPSIVIEKCQETFEVIQRSGVEHEFRTTVYPALHTEEDLHAIAGTLLPGETYMLQSMRFGKTLVPNLSHATPYVLEDVVQRMQEAFPEVVIKTRGAF